MELLEYFKYDENCKNALWANKHYHEAIFNEITVEYNEYGDINIRAKIKVCGYLNDLNFTISEFGDFFGECDCIFFKSVNNPCGHFIMLAMKLKELSPFKIPFKFKTKSYSFDDEEDGLSRYERILKKLEEERKIVEFNKKKDSSLRLLDHSKSEVMNSLILDNDKNIYKKEVYLIIEPSEIYSYNRDFTYRLKIAHNKSRAYYIKDVYRLLDDIDNRNNVKYGKELEFVHDLEAFDDNSIKIIECLKRSINSSYYGDYKEFEPYNLLIFYNLLKELPSKYHPNINVYESDFKLKLIKEVKDDYIEFTTDDDIPSLYNVNINDKCYFQAYDNSILKVNINKETINLARHLYDYDSLYIPNDSIDDFYNFIYKPCLKYVDFDNFEYQSQNKLEKIEIYADLDDDYYLSMIASYYIDNQKYYLDNDDIKPFECELIKKCLDNYRIEVDKEIHIIRIKKEEDIKNFLNKGLEFIMQYANVYVSDVLKNYNHPKRIGINVGVKLNNDLLNLDINAINIDKDEIIKILGAYRKKKKFHRLKNGELIAINQDEFEELDNTLNELGIEAKAVKKDINLPLYKAMTLETLTKYNELNYDLNDVYKEFIKKIELKNIDSYQVPSIFDGILKEYQVFGYRWLMMLRDYGLGGILADDMGLGKTLQYLTYIYANKSDDKTSLVICPASLIYNWKDEAYKFAKDLKVICINGSQTNRKELIKDINNYDLVVTSYDYIRRDYELYRDFTFDTIALDEAQYIKNQTTKNAKSVKELKAKYRLALSGTPIENSLAELWSIFDFLMPDYLSNYHYFKANYESPIIKNQDEDATKRLKAYVEPFILRRRKKDVLKDLPDRIDKTIYIDFNEEEEKLYQASAIMASSELKEMLDIDSDNFNKVKILAMLNKLRQLCIEPRLQYSNVKEISSKMKACLELLERLKANGEKTLIFSSYTSLLSLLEEELSKNKITYYKLTGQTSKEERRELVSKFQNDDTDVFLISLKAGGTGLNLTSASAVIHFDPWWNISAQNQASDRAHRIGQKNTVQVFSLIMKNSIEERIEELQKSKKELSDLFPSVNKSDNSFLLF